VLLRRFIVWKSDGDTAIDIRKFGWCGETVAEVIQGLQELM
jgi:hypothetical protein